MSGWSPPAPSNALVSGIGVVLLLWLAYAVLIQASVLLGLLPGVFVVAAYVLWRFLVAIEAIADGVHRIADSREGD